MPNPFGFDWQRKCNVQSKSNWSIQEIRLASFNFFADCSKFFIIRHYIFLNYLKPSDWTSDKVFFERNQNIKSLCGL